MDSHDNQNHTSSNDFTILIIAIALAGSVMAYMKNDLQVDFGKFAIFLNISLSLILFATAIFRGLGNEKDKEIENRPLVLGAFAMAAAYILYFQLIINMENSLYASTMTLLVYIVYSTGIISIAAGCFSWLYNTINIAYQIISHIYKEFYNKIASRIQS